MASDKLKRFRTHVVKELYETERNYTSALEFTVTVSEIWLVLIASSSITVCAKYFF